MKVKSKSLRRLKLKRKILTKKIVGEIKTARQKVGWFFLFILSAFAIAIAV
ncbi:hypothetical protein [Amylibacter sp. SFDW26]|uniref:hypothetical protein n=1 Tax=Amylibacter sp. SFDW26 TaxID=2652722 RepID=UPI00186A9ED0|nr:hypothetical protein [Amylibacter sp. SFDW26]